MMLTDQIWRNFGVIEWLACVEIVILLAAGFFYRVARLIARTDRQDPLVRFYRVFWRNVLSSVPSIRELDLRQAELIARAAGLGGTGDLSREQLARLDAPQLPGSEDWPDGDAMMLPALPGTDKNPDPDESTAPSSNVRVIGRTSPPDEDRLAPLRKGANTESRESRFARLAREKREGPPDVAQARNDPAARVEVSAEQSKNTLRPNREQTTKTARPSSAERADGSSSRSGLPEDAPIPVSVDRSPISEPAPDSAEQRTTRSKFDVRIDAMQPQNAIIGWRDGEVVIEVTHAAEDGYVNGVIIELLASRIGVRPYQIVLLGGHYKVRKTLQVSGLDQNQLNAKLEQI